MATTESPPAAAPADRSSKKSKLGFYADPRSPIASTPLKRQRTSKATSDGKPAATEDASASTELTAPCPIEEEITTRRLDMNVEDEETDESKVTIHPTTTAGKHSTADDEVDLFSPALKVDGRITQTLHPHLPSIPSTSSTTATVVVPVPDSAVPSEPDAEAPATPTSLKDDESVVEVDFNPFYFMKTLPRYSDLHDVVRPIALPPKDSTAPKLCLVLDLDETLVHCTIDDIPQADMKFPIEYDSHEYIVSVKRRPFMMEFLSQVSEWFEVVVFTASQRVYAETLLDLLDPYHQLIQHRLYRENCLPVDGNYLKDLNVLGRDLAHVLLIDNSPHAFGYQVTNGVPIESWFSDESDSELLKLLPFLESLLHVDDVRPVLAKQFQIQRLIDAAVLE
ncbi:hypothetical protein H310_12439 [Aphanomyces invadans]|uniref:FCP1 homology domain-containing protein n=1 Tax=Aphanomyces invadans TaxID=157072 RepID=A0A024TJY1_9STRA|nr:hypothetical protein H310_12439 [Aphanomyces invadans]ETV93672.1 hypothetical protein H310_12439 [Aphanomyces invadans]|eukprot:XP_008877713.1 hypothetical protein H310_12439 [Aphanomyces invadans]